MIELFTAATPNGWKISIALEELALPYTVRQIALSTRYESALAGRLLDMGPLCWAPHMPFRMSFASWPSRSCDRLNERRL